jgi:hypothetical protein
VSATDRSPATERPARPRSSGPDEPMINTNRLLTADAARAANQGPSLGRLCLGNSVMCRERFAAAPPERPGLLPHAPRMWIEAGVPRGGRRCRGRAIR